MKKIIILILTLVSITIADIYKVTKVVDGDTIHVVDNNDTVIKVRLAYIDTMESRYNTRLKSIESSCNINKESILELGKYSSNYMKVLLPINSYVNLDIKDKDMYGRYVALVYRHNITLNYSDNIAVNEIMLQYGYAIPYTKYIKNNISIVNYYNELFNIGVSKNNAILNNECVINTLTK